MRALVVGAGIAGPTLSYWLARAGHEVTLVERAPELRKGGYLVDFWGTGFDVAERMGIVPELRRRGHQFTEVRAIDREGRRVATFTPDAVMGSTQRYVSIARSALAEVVYEAISGSVELVLGDSAASIHDTGGAVEVTLESGRELEVDLVFGADGLHSRVRRLAFGPDETYERYLGIVVSAFEVSGYQPRDELIAMMYADIGYQVVRLSLPGGSTLLLVSLLHDGAVPVDDPAAQQALLSTALAGAGWETPRILDAMRHADSFYFDAVSQIRMPSWTRGRVALVGDAAACPSFLAGQGSALAMAEAYTLAAELVASGGDHEAAFGRYHERLAGMLTSKQDAAIRLAVAFAPRNAWQLGVRNMALKAMGLPLVSGLVMGRSFRDPVPLPEFAAA
jgi:2-polyprenyl-6-methoxyphenol hydroxylase-like FAD-dependent oxidoreductase